MLRGAGIQTMDYGVHDVEMDLTVQKFSRRCWE